MLHFKKLRCNLSNGYDVMLHIVDLGCLTPTIDLHISVPGSHI